MTENHRRSGPFVEGERAQLIDAKGKINTITLGSGCRFHTHKGFINHDDIIGASDASIIENDSGLKYQVMRPLLNDFVMSMPRGAAIIYPKDSGTIISQTDIFPGATVVEAGVGSGALSLALLQAIGPEGALNSFEIRPEFAEIAISNVEAFYGFYPSNWTVTEGDLAVELQHTYSEGQVDRVVLDMLAPWETIEAVADVLISGGVLTAYVATVTQMSRFVEALSDDGRFSPAQCSETITRGWHVEGLAVRPDHRMVGHTGFLITTRKMAPGHSPLLKVRRKSKSEYSAEDLQNWLPDMVGQPEKSDKRLRKIIKEADTIKNAKQSQSSENKQG